MQYGYNPPSSFQDLIRKRSVGKVQLPQKAQLDPQ